MAVFSFFHNGHLLMIAIMVNDKSIAINELEKYSPV